MADGHLIFDTKINTKQFSNGIGTISSSVDKLKVSLLKLGGVFATVFSVNALRSFAKEAKELWNVQLEAETKLNTILGQNLGATNEQIQAVKDYASALQEVGVIGDEIQLSGLQELSTYIDNADSLKTMNEVLNDMLAQQYGLNATAENAVTISTMLGKVLEGQTSALSRYGYSFDSAQEQLLKFGTEEQKVATLAEVVSASVGGINEALANTDAGRMKQLSNTMDDIKEQFGAAITQIEVLFLPALKKLATLFSYAAAYAREFSQALSEVFGAQGNTKAVASSASAAAESYEEMAEAAEAAADANERTLAGFDQINKLGSNDQTSSSTSGSEVSEPSSPAAFSLEIDTEHANEKLKQFIKDARESFETMLAPLKNAWDKYGGQVMDSARGTIENIKGLFGDIGKSFTEVWTNGTGERILGHHLEILRNIFDIVGNIADRLRTAWNTDNIGTEIIQKAADIWDTILVHVESITRKMADWSKTLDFAPILKALSGLEEALQPFVDKVWDGIEWLFDNIFLPLGEWVIEDALPVTLDLVSAAVDVLTAAATALEKPGKWLWEKFLQPLSAWAGKIAVDGIKTLSSVLKKLGDWITQHQTAAAWFTGLTAAVLALNAASAAGGIGVLVSNLGTMLKALATMDVTVGVIIAGIAGWVYAISEIADNWDAICEVIEADGGIFGFIAGWIESCTEDIEEFFDASWFGSLWKDFWEAAGGLIYDAIDALTDWVTEPMACISSTYSSVGKNFKKWFDNARKMVENAFKDVGDWFGNRWRDITNAFSNIENWFTTTFGSAYRFMTEAFSNTRTFFVNRYNDITAAFSNIEKWFSSHFTLAWNAIINAFSRIGRWAGDRYDDITRGFKNVGEWFSTAFKRAYANITSAFANIRTFFKEKYDDVTGIFSGIGGWFKGRFEAAYKNVTDAFSAIKTWFQDRYNDVTEIFMGIGGWFRGRFQAAYDNIVNVFSPVASFFKGIWDGIGNGLAGAINWILDRYNDFMGKLCSLINDGIDMINALSFDFLGMHFGPNLGHVSAPHVDHISGLATGTVVPANFGEYLAILGDNKREPEVVSPLSTMKQALKEAFTEMGFGGGGGDGTTTINLELDGEPIYRAVVKQNKKHVDSTGTNELIY